MQNGFGPGEIPVGLGMALAQNMEAMKRFSDLPESERQAFVALSHDVNSKEEMQARVRELTK